MSNALGVDRLVPMPSKGISADGFLSLVENEQHQQGSNPYAATLVTLLPNSHAIDVTAAGNGSRLHYAAGHINQPFEIEQGIRPTFSFP